MNYKDKKILIADDDHGTRGSLGLILDRLGYKLHFAKDGAKARELIKTNRYDYVFLDCNMPGLTGIELIKGIKERWPDTITIVITGYGGINKDFALTLGAHEYIEKPFHGEEIKGIITRYRLK